MLREPISPLRLAGARVELVPQLLRGPLWTHYSALTFAAAFALAVALGETGWASGGNALLPHGAISGQVLADRERLTALEALLVLLARAHDDVLVGAGLRPAVPFRGWPTRVFALAFALALELVLHEGHDLAGKLVHVDVGVGGEAGVVVVVARARESHPF